MYKWVEYYCADDNKETYAGDTAPHLRFTRTSKRVYCFAAHALNITHLLLLLFAAVRRDHVAPGQAGEAPPELQHRRMCLSE
jgi:hypothetical protein